MERLTCLAVQTIATQPELLERALKQLEQQQAHPQTTERERLKDLLRDLDKRERAIIEAQIAGIPDDLRCLRL
jgi:FixJ family two-component response regulator